MVGRPSAGAALSVPGSFSVLNAGPYDPVIKRHFSILVEKHRSNLMKKLDLHNASMLTRYAIEKGLVGG